MFRCRILDWKSHARNGMGKENKGGHKMKKLIIGGAMALMLSTAQAREMKGNPDRFPSVGLNYSVANLDGLNEENIAGVLILGNTELTQRSVSLDLRLPVTDGMTVNTGITSMVSETSSTYDSLNSRGDQTLDGYAFNVGVRFYFRQ